MKRKINEIFLSLQGEGAHTGVPSLFIRFSGCNMKCGFCDTRHEEGRWMEDAEIFSTAAESSAPWIILTGGEPSLWIDAEFVSGLKRATGKLIAIETNGSRPLPPGLDWVTVSPKQGMEGASDYPLLAGRADELKVVDTGQPLEGYFECACVGEGTRMYLQPCHVDDPVADEANLRRTVERVIADPRWTLSLQTHRLIGIS